MKKRIVIPGGSGAVGTLLASRFHRQGQEVVVLSRRPQKQPWKPVPWDGGMGGASGEAWSREIDGVDVVINLTGRNVDCRYTPANRREILESRVASTRAVGRAIAAAARPPAVWINASTATIYRHALDRAMDEATGELGASEAGASQSWAFSVGVAKAWEEAFFAAPAPRTRKVAIRSAMVAIPHTSWLGKLTRLARWGLGGPAGAGTQYMSWIHHEDFARAIEFLIARDDLQGCLNLAAPHPLPHAAFMRALRAAAGIAIGPRLPVWTLRLGSWMMGTEAELILKSRRVVPGRLLAAGFVFRYPHWPDAAGELLGRAQMPALA